MSHMTPYAYEIEMDRRMPRAKINFPSASTMLQRLPPHFREVSLDDYQAATDKQQHVKDLVQDLISVIEIGKPVGQTKGLTIIGQPGVGKTMLGCVVLRHAFECRKSFDFMPVADYVRMGQRIIDMSQRSGELDLDEHQELDELRERLWQLAQVKVLVLDDLGKEYGKLVATPGAASWAESELDTLVRSRWNHGVGPTIITSNIKIDDWEKRYRGSLASFVWEMSDVCELWEQVDWRGKG